MKPNDLLIFGSFLMCVFTFHGMRFIKFISFGFLCLRMKGDWVKKGK